MPPVKSIVTFVEVDPREPGRSVHARLDAVLSDGSRLTLLDDRGWAGGRIEDWTVAEVESTARTVVGPEEPLASRGETELLMTESHQQMLQRKLDDAGVDADGLDFYGLPHDVELGQRLRDRLKS